MNRRGFLSFATAAAALSLLPTEPVIALPNARKIFLPPRGGWPCYDNFNRPDIDEFETNWVEADASDWSISPSTRNVTPSGYFADCEEGFISLWRIYTDGSEERISRERVSPIKACDIVSLTVSSEGQRAAINGVTRIGPNAPHRLSWPKDDRLVRVAPRRKF